MTDTEVRLALIERSLLTLESIVEELRDSNKSISLSLAKIASLEDRHIETRDAMNACFDQIRKHDQQITRLEERIIPLKEARGWIISAVLAIVGAVGVAVVTMVIKSGSP